jgi:hypothetical protein
MRHHRIIMAGLVALTLSLTAAPAAGQTCTSAVRGSVPSGFTPKSLVLGSYTPEPGALLLSGLAGLVAFSRWLRRLGKPRGGR